MDGSEIVMQGSSVSVVVPVYNGAAFLGDLVAQLRAVLREREAGYEIILVNDGSRDDSWMEIARLVATDHHIRGFDLMRNYGQHNALLAGIREARHDVIVTMDDDLQHPPAEIPRLLEMLGPNCDLVYGAAEVEQHGLLRNAASSITKRILQVAMGIPNARSLSAFRAFRTDIRRAFHHFRGPFVSIDVLLTWGTSRICYVRVGHHRRTGGVSNYSVWQLLAHALNLLTGFSVLPLQFASLLGFVLTLFGISVLIYVTGRYLALGGSVPGFPFLASIIAIFSGAQLFALGIIGEYVARIHFRIMDRPAYEIRDSVEPAGSRLERTS